MPRFAIALVIGSALLVGVAGCFGEQGASVAPSTTPVVSGDSTSNAAKGKINSAGEKPTVNVSPVQ